MKLRRRSRGLQQDLEIIQEMVGRETFERYKCLYEALASTIGLDDNIRTEWLSRKRRAERYENFRRFIEGLSLFIPSRDYLKHAQDVHRVSNIFSKYMRIIDKYAEDSWVFYPGSLIKELGPIGAKGYLYRVFKENESIFSEEDKKEIEEMLNT